MIDKVAAHMKPYYQDEQSTIYCGDCLEILPQLPKVDLVLTDPPYGCGRSSGVGQYGREKWAASDTKWDAGIPSVELLRAVVGHGVNAIVWGGNYFPLPLSRMFLIWDKGAGFRGRDFAEVEQAWCSWDGNAKILMRDPLANRDYIGKQHPTEKPVAVMVWCLQLWPSAQTIIDPFMGSGSTLVAAKRMGRRAIGIEIEERYCAIAVERLRQQSLFADELSILMNTVDAQIKLGARDIIAEEAFTDTDKLA